MVLNQGWNRDYTNKSSKGQYRLRRKTKVVSIGLYFFLIAMILGLILVVTR